MTTPQLAWFDIVLGGIIAATAWRITTKPPRTTHPRVARTTDPHNGFVKDKPCDTQRLRQSLDGAINKHYQSYPYRDPTHDELRAIIHNTRADDYVA